MFLAPREVLQWRLNWFWRPCKTYNEAKTNFGHPCKSSRDVKNVFGPPCNSYNDVKTRFARSGRVTSMPKTVLDHRCKTYMGRQNQFWRSL